MKKRAIRTVAFLSCLFVLLFVLCDMFEQENNTNHNQRFYTYRGLSDNTVDAVAIGTSGIDRYIIPSQIYEDYGMTVYSLATDGFPSWLYINVIEDALRYQNPELFIIDIRPFGQDNLKIKPLDVSARRILDVMSPFSPNRFKAALKTMKVIHSVDSSAPAFDASYFLSFIKYHGKWDNDNYSLNANIGECPHNYLGFYISDDRSIANAKFKSIKYDPNFEMELDPVSQESLYELIDYIKEKELNVLFIDTPQANDKKKMGRSNTVYKILEQEGLPYLHYYTKDTKTGISLDLDFATDFYNSAHVNYYGACEYTRALSQYLDKNYDLADRRGDDKVKKDWDDVNDALKNKIKTLEEIANSQGAKLPN